MIDSAADISLWARNQPRRLRIPTPAGDYHPDFVAIVVNENENNGTILIEVKGDDFWEPPTSEARLKASAGAKWCKCQRDSGHKFTIYVALESDIKRVSSWPELEPHLIKPE